MLFSKKRLCVWKEIVIDSVVWLTSLLIAIAIKIIMIKILKIRGLPITIDVLISCYCHWLHSERKTHLNNFFVSHIKITCEQLLHQQKDVLIFNWICLRKISSLSLLLHGVLHRVLPIILIKRMNFKIQTFFLFFKNKKYYKVNVNAFLDFSLSLLIWDIASPYINGDRNYFINCCVWKIMSCP